MKVNCIGTGSAFTTTNYQSNFIIEKNGKRLLIDCGTDIRHSLKAAGLSAKDIDAIYISHLHSDHCGGMEYIAFNTYFDPNKSKPDLFGKPIVLQGLWEGLRQGLLILNDRLAGFKDYFSITNVQDKFTWEGIEFHLVQTEHCKNAWALMPSFGLWMPQYQVLITTDCKANLMAGNPEMYSKAITVFQDCETAKFPTGVHAHYNELKTFPPDIRKKMWLYHYQDGDLPNAEVDGFAGFIRQGQIFEFQD